MADVRRVGESFRPFENQVNQAKDVCARVQPVQPTWQDVLRQAIDRGLREIEKELAAQSTLGDLRPDR